jgi:hypothetical protein
MMKAWTRVVGLVAVGALSLGCVGYDGGSDAASAQAAALGVTAEEERAIRDALAKPALTEEDLAIERKLAAGQAITVEQFEAMKAELEKWEKLPEEQRVRSMVGADAQQRNRPDGERCWGDVNCRSKHCDQAGICLAASRFKPSVTTARRASEAACSAGWECQSNRCTLGFCVDPLATDSNGRKDARETDVDCGGPRGANGEGSPYSCPLLAKCDEDDDCVVGYCIEVVGRSGATGSKVCTTLGANLTDVGRLWKADMRAGSSAPYTTEVRLPARRTRAAQIEAVRNAPELYSTSAAAGSGQLASTRLVPARETRTYQHDTCAAHLIGNGCSPAAFQARAHRESFDYFICPRSSRDAIGISALESGQGAATDFGSLNNARGSRPLKQDPYLCNQSFTRGVRVFSKSRRSTRDAIQLPWARFGAWIDGNFPRIYFDGYLPLSAKGWWNKGNIALTLDELQEFLLLGAACNRGRVSVGGARLETQEPRNINGGSLERVRAFCEARNIWSTPLQIADGQQTQSVRDEQNEVTGAWNLLFPPAERSALLEFVKTNVPYWEDYDVYSIDPEGNPYKPVNKNMQWGWDAMHPSMSFQQYSASYGLALVPTGETYSFGTSTGQVVWGQRQPNGGITAFNYAR